MEQLRKEVSKVQFDFKAMVAMINSSFGENYAAKNPGLVQFLLDKIQQEEDRVICKKLNSIAD